MFLHDAWLPHLNLEYPDIAPLVSFKRVKVATVIRKVKS